MYKTVRQGDASLQYTILPQVDQFYVNEMSSISNPPTAGSPVKDTHHCPLEERIRVTTARTICLILLIVTMFVCCAIGAYLIDEMVSRRCAVTTFKPAAPLTNGYLKTVNSQNNKDEIQGNKDSATTTTIATTTSPQVTSEASRILADKETSGLSSRFSTSSSAISKEEPSNLQFTMSETPSSSTPETHGTLFSSTEAGTTTSAAPSFSSLDDVGSSASEVSPDSRASIISAAPTNSIVNILRKLKMMKIPRFTLKLTRITATIPQMYLKAGIASYKKGKITTSVLAQGLTLEGLIFKTPDGTINPWRAKWPFDQEDTDSFHRKRTFARDLTALAMLIGIVLMLVLLVMVLRLVRSAIERWQNFEEIQTENRDEAHSTLLDAQSEDPEDKE